MNKKDTFTSERLFFRGISEEDADQLVQWRSDPDVIRYFRNANPISKGTHMRWYASSYCKDFGRYDFMVIHRQDERPIGTVGISRLNWETRSCEISYMVAESDYQRCGYAVEMIAAMMKLAAREGVHHFFAEIHRENLASIRTIEKIRFVRVEEKPPFFVYHKREESDALHPRRRQC